jgi:hypothetical protein
MLQFAEYGRRFCFERKFREKIFFLTVREINVAKLGEEKEEGRWT